MISADLLQTLFEGNNARTQSLTEVVDTFVAPDSFWRLLSAKHHVVLGSRGSGKTAVLKMLSHDHFSRFDNPTTKRLLRERSFVGVYVPMRAEWVGTLKNKPWQTPEEMERWFQWRLNLSTCSAFVDTMQSCVNTYVIGVAERIILEKKLSVSISSAWSNNSFVAENFGSLRAFLEDVEWSRQMSAVTRKAGAGRASPGATFEMELFAPLRRGIALLKREIVFPAATIWAVCLDELEFLDTPHHRILNTHMRSASGNLFFKMATMPYFHHTFSTNLKANLVHGDDFEYVYLDFDPAFRGTDRQPWMDWAEQILRKKLSFMGIRTEHFSFADVFGARTPLLDEKDQDWTIESPMMGILRRFASPETFDRARSLAGSPAFRDQISRKIHGTLLLRNAAWTKTGNAEHELYGGPKMVARCSDANPRQLIRIFNTLSFRNPDPGRKNARVPIYRPSLREQTRMMIDYSGEVLELAACEEAVGDRLVAFIRQLGQYFHNRFYAEPVSTDHFFAITVEQDVDDETWYLVKYAVGLGLLFPKGRPGSKKPEVLPGKGGSFNLAYRLAPVFGLLPRRGRPVSLSTILKTPVKVRRKDSGANQYALPVEDESSE